MLGFIKFNKEPINTKEPSKTWAQKLKESLQRTRNNLIYSLNNVLLNRKTIDKSLLEELETTLLLADLGINTTQSVLEKLEKSASLQELHNTEILINNLKKELFYLLEPYELPLVINKKPFIILMVGANGAGKTTTSAKLAYYFKQQNKTVMFAAGDTFRAAAIEQIQTWGGRNGVPVIAQHQGADSASVIYDAMESAKAKEIEVLIADTAGRLHTQDNLMSELQKI